MWTDTRLMLAELLEKGYGIGHFIHNRKPFWVITDLGRQKTVIAVEGGKVEELYFAHGQHPGTFLPLLVEHYIEMDYLDFEDIDNTHISDKDDLWSDVAIAFNADLSEVVEYVWEQYKKEKDLI